jgi:predicted acylesterase/phospholipase RssA
MTSDNPDSGDQDLGRRFCDIVMKGGITSGVVYPSAISRLAEKYQLRNIGGASAGAIAAAGAAAAEYRRQTAAPADRMKGFNRLKALAEELGAKEHGAPQSRLFQLFLPSTEAKPLFELLAKMLNKSSAVTRAVSGLIALALLFPGSAAVGLAVGAVCISVVLRSVGAFPFMVPSAPGVDVLNLASLVLCGAFVLISTISLVFLLCSFRVISLFFKVMSSQNFGLCKGMRGTDQVANSPALTEWLYELFQDLSGKTHSQPLTFGDLANTRFEGPGDHVGISLRMMTTCLTVGRPYSLPFDESVTFYFDPIELRDYFPDEVVDWMVQTAVKPKVSVEEIGLENHESSTSQQEQEVAIPANLMQLPNADDLPVIFGVRMSLSFPILLSALPLHRIRLVKKPPTVPNGVGRWEKRMERVLFTDGGVCSNLPVHMFDAPLPNWPTFAINLRSDLQAWEKESDRAVRPKRGQGFHGDFYPIVEDSSFRSVLSFFAAIVSTMQNWRDVLGRSAPGSRDRVVTVRHTESEGGLNLNMELAAIGRMAKSGTLAADLLIRDFRPDPRPSPETDEWTYHRWVRTRNQVRALHEYLLNLTGSYSNIENHPVIAELVGNSKAYVDGSYKFDQKNADAANDFLDRLTALMDEMKAINPNFDRKSPRPRAELRTTPRI